MKKTTSLFYLLGLICGKGYILENSISINFPHHKKIVEGMIRIINNNKSMSEAARTRASEKFDMKNWLERHKIIFDLVLKSKI